MRCRRIGQNRREGERRQRCSGAKLRRAGEENGRYGGGEGLTKPSTLNTVSVVERYRAGDRRHPLRNDTIAGGLVFALTTLNVLTNGSSPSERRTGIVFFVVASATIALRRVFPYTAMAVATGLLVSILFVPREGTGDVVAFWSTFYTAGTLGAATIPSIPIPRLASVAGARNAVRAVSVVAIVVGVSIAASRGILSDDPTTGEPPGNAFIAGALEIILIFAFVGSAWFIGDLVRLRRENDRELSERNAELVQQRAENERRAVIEERVRISRELHDVVAHHVSLMGVQAGAARMALRQTPEKAEVALSEVERSSRQAVSELQRLLGFLRQDEPDTTRPQPTLNDLNALVADVERAGRKVRLERCIDEDPELPSSVQLTAFRIVQEALTNAVKHSTDAPIDVCVSFERDALRVIVDDHGSPRASTGETAKGHGLVGIRERVAFHGGTVSITPSPTRFTIDARLPLETRDTQ